jgi:hypothetical protein
MSRRSEGAANWLCHGEKPQVSRDFFIICADARGAGELSYKLPVMRMHSQEWLCHCGCAHGR